MEENSNIKQNPEEPKNPLLAALETIISGNEEIKLQQQKISQNQEQILQSFSGKENQLKQESSELENLSKKISADIQLESRENLTKIQNLFDTEHEKLKSVEFKISGQDRNLINRIDRIFQQYWKLPVIVATISLLMAGLTSFLAVRFYSESVKSREELKQDLAMEHKATNKIIVDKKQWDKYSERERLIELWSQENPKDSKSLNDFIVGYEVFKKNNKIKK